MCTLTCSQIGFGRNSLSFLVTGHGKFSVPDKHSLATVT